MKGKKIWFLLNILLIGSSTAVFWFSWENYTWNDTSSCIHFSQQLEALNKKPLAQEKPWIDKNQVEAPIYIENVTSTSDTFFTDYNTTTKEITLIKGPKNPNSNLIDMSKIKKIALLKLPHSFEDVNVHFFKESVMIISATQNKNQKAESILLFYQISNDKISPLHSIKITGKLEKLQIQNEKLYLISSAPLSPESTKKLIQKRWDIPEIFPKISEGLAYSLPATQEDYATCRDLKIFSNPEIMPSFWTFFVVDLKNIQNAKDRLTLFGNFDDFYFSPDFLYTISYREGKKTLIQKFWLEPKINHQTSVILEWELVDNWFIDEKTNPIALTTRSSWKFTSISAEYLDKNLQKTTNTELFSGGESFNQAIFVKNLLFLKGNEKERTLIAKRNPDSTFSRIPPFTITNWEQLFTLGEKDSSFLKLIETWDKVRFSFFDPDKNQNERNRSFSYAGTSQLLWTPFWNQSLQILFLPIKITNETSNFLGIKALKIDQSGSIKELFWRKYPDSWSTFLNMNILPNFSYIITNDLIDIFIINTPRIMSILKK